MEIMALQSISHVANKTASPYRARVNLSLAIEFVLTFIKCGFCKVETAETSGARVGVNEEICMPADFFCPLNQIGE